MELRQKTEKAIFDQVHLPGAEQVILRLLNEKDDKQAAMDLLISYAKDIVAMWPNISFRTLRSLHEKVMGLKEALEMLGK